MRTKLRIHLTPEEAQRLGLPAYYAQYGYVAVVELRQLDEDTQATARARCEVYTDNGRGLQPTYIGVLMRRLAFSAWEET